MIAEVAIVGLSRGCDGCPVPARVLDAVGCFAALGILPEDLPEEIEDAAQIACGASGDSSCVSALAPALKSVLPRSTKWKGKMIASISVLAGISAAIFGRALSSRPALLDTPRLPAAMRFSASELLAIAAVLRFGGLVTLGGVVISGIARTVS